MYMSLKKAKVQLSFEFFLAHEKEWTKLCVESSSVKFLFRVRHVFRSAVLSSKQISSLAQQRGEGWVGTSVTVL